MAPRWKGKGKEAEALADPISRKISQLQISLQKSQSQGILVGCTVILGADEEQTKILTDTCFGRPIITSKNPKQFFQLTLEEAFYLSYSLHCIQIITSKEKEAEDSSIINHKQLWNYMKLKRDSFPNSFKAYSHLRAKNWVVRSGSQYGVDFVAYRHHPSLVHSEYAVLVLSESDDISNGRLRVWSDFHCTVRLCGSVAKTLLVLAIDQNGSGVDDFPACLEKYNVEERTITRWNAEQCREDQKLMMENGEKIEAMAGHMKIQAYLKGNQ